MAPPIGKKQMKVNHMTYAVMLRELMVGPCTARELAEVSGLAVLTVQRLLRVWRRYAIVHVASWEKDVAGRMTIPVIALGEGKDAKKNILPQSAIRARYLEKERAAKRLAAVTTGAAP